MPFVCAERLTEKHAGAPPSLLQVETIQGWKEGRIAAEKYYAAEWARAFFADEEGEGTFDCRARGGQPAPELALLNEVISIPGVKEGAKGSSSCGRMPSISSAVLGL